ncbi:MAG: nitrate- and nitrite sensing domain-containing protein, partial [Arcobacter sp.]|nr:nitrate- and nitrite sensing domain-containing protein [Arcobacter sp.]
MNNLKLKNKILLILALPILAVLILSSISIFENIEKENKMSKTAEYINFTVKVSDFLTHFQNERELGILYLDSYGKNKKDELIAQIKNSQERIDELNNFIEVFRLVKNDNNLSSKIDNFKNEFNNIEEIRKNILDLKMDTNELISNYNKNI